MAKKPFSKKLPSVKLNFIDRLVTAVNPVKGMERLRARAAFGFLESSGYITSSSYKRSMRGWNTAGGTADQDVLPKAGQARKDSRDLYMNTPLATSALKRVKTNAVGSGLTLQSRIDREYLRMSDEQADEWEKQAEREFKLWAEDKRYCDASMIQNFYELQASALFNMMLSGDVFALLPYITRKGHPYNLRIQLIEADRISNPNLVPDTKYIAGGIKVGDHGEPLSYYISQRTNQGLIGLTSIPTKWTEVKAFGSASGRRNILHLYTKDRPGQRRGMPLLAPVVEVLKQQSRLTEAELMAAVISSFFTVFIKSTTPTGLAPQYIDEERVANPDADSTGVGSGTEADTNVMELGSGGIFELGQDQSIDVADPKRPNDGFEPFFLALTKQIGAAIEVPFEQLILHFSSSYSASRAALLEAWKFYRERRLWLARNFCNPVYDEWMAEAVASGRLSAPGFFDDPLIRKAWTGCSWGGPGQGQIDPLKETKAAQGRIDYLLSSFEDEHTAINGGDWEGTFNRAVRERTQIQNKGMQVPTSLKDHSAGISDGDGATRTNDTRPEDE